MPDGVDEGSSVGGAMIGLEGVEEMVLVGTITTIGIRRRGTLDLWGHMVVRIRVGHRFPHPQPKEQEETILGRAGMMDAPFLLHHSLVREEIDLMGHRRGLVGGVLEITMRPHQLNRGMVRPRRATDRQEGLCMMEDFLADQEGSSHHRLLVPHGDLRMTLLEL